MLLRPVLAALALVAAGSATSVAVWAAAPGVPSPRTAAGTFASASVPTVVTYAAPVSPVTVVRPFVPPSSPYGPGHRGVDLATADGRPVAAAGVGVVRFAGRVAGRGLVVVAHPDGLTTEYEPLSVTVHAGDPVARGDPIGTVQGRHGSCDPGACLHWAARRGDVYLDPMTLLRGLGPVRLLPWSPAEDP